jgi:hypothetical protein
MSAPARRSRAEGGCRVFRRLDRFLAGAADATLRLIEVSGVVHDVELGGVVIGATLATAMQHREVGASPTRSSPL